MKLYIKYLGKLRKVKRVDFENKTVAFEDTKGWTATFGKRKQNLCAVISNYPIPKEGLIVK